MQNQEYSAPAVWREHKRLWLLNQASLRIAMADAKEKMLQNESEYEENLGVGLITQVLASEVVANE